ncbi:receptor-like protein 6 [Cornus florida]|uniref:receptor-like protein 6 n=1 Tax=Cornus florida TaxID=4283 RepID=UPI0028A04167|nr:receptor-like protein 6 [Cornus florida]
MVSLTYTLTLTNKGVQIVYLYILNIFTAIDLSSNRFEGEIPESIGILKCLHMLNLSNNNLIGQIPSSLGNLTEIESFDISKNKLSGEIPEQLTHLTFLEFFNVSFNHLRGPIPRERQFNTFPNNSYEGNLGLCGDPLPNKCDNSYALLPPPLLSNFKQDGDHSWLTIDKSDWIVICMGYGGGLVVGLIIGHSLVARLFHWRRYIKEMKNFSSSMEFPPAISSSTSVHQLCHDNESSALMQFKQSLFIRKYASRNPSAYPKVAWNPESNSTDCCSWDGVTCNAHTGHVIGLDLSSSYLYGSINSTSSLFHLVHLQRLNLADNYFNHSLIPSAVGRLSRLTYLNLSFSSFSGQIPLEISKLTTLASLDLSVNPLKLQNPSLASLVQNLTALKELHLFEVNISSAVPNILTKFSSLKSLSLGYCGLHGEFPVGIFKLPNLQELGLWYNQKLSGYLPEFHTRSPLKRLALVGTSFSGELPNSIGKLDSLNDLDIAECNFSGLIPSSFSNFTQLIYLNLSANHFMGHIPSSFGSLTQLGYLDLSFNHFVGHIPASFSNLTQITELYFSDNNFNGENLSLLGKLTKLVFLDLTGNNLMCEIPSSFGNLTQLLGLSFQSSQITGRIPSWLMNLTQLVYLYLPYNLLQGSIPESISELKNLQDLDLGFNNLSGTMKLDVFLTLKNLFNLQLSGNQLALLTSSTTNATFPNLILLELASCNLTEFPEFLKFQDKLRWLDLSNNRIQGLLPAWIWNMSTKTLQAILLSRNFIAGFHQPPLVLPWGRLHILDLSSNLLQGSLPVPPSSTFVYNVSNNQLSGEIQPIICNMSFLHAMDLSYNNLSGIIPQCLGSFADSLSLLNLRSNNLHGSIPQTYKKGTKLRMINLSQNQLQGPVPRSLINCSLLESLDLGSNQINDTFPFWLGALPGLQVLVLRSNRFHGAIWNPKPGFGFPKLHIIDLSHNGFVGKLPSDYFQTWTAMKTTDVNHLTYIGAIIELNLYDEIGGKVWHDNYSYSMTLMNKGVQIVYSNILNILAAIDLSSNRFEGEISESIGILKGLHVLNLSNNSLIGHIPSSFGNLTELESLDISQNKISGEIPEELTQLTFLSVLNASHNYLTGPIPRGRQFDTFQNNSYVGNSGLCGEPLSKKCGSLEASPPPSNFEQNEDHSWFPISKTDWIVICMGYGGGLVVGLIIGHTLTTRYHEWFVSTFGRRQQKQRRGRCF